MDCGWNHPDCPGGCGRDKLEMVENLIGEAGNMFSRAGSTPAFSLEDIRGMKPDLKEVLHV